MPNTSCCSAGADAEKDLEAILATHGRGRDQVIPLLQEIQERFKYLSPEAIDRVAKYLGLSGNDVYGVATFYAQFRFTPPGQHHIRVCLGTACHVRGGDRILNAITSVAGIEPGQTSADGLFSLERVACFGSCALAPVVVVDDQVHGRMTVARTQKLIKDSKKTSKKKEKA